MSPQDNHEAAARWRRIEEILSQLLDVEGDTRERKLRELTAEQPELRDEIRGLLATDTARFRHIDRFLEEGAEPLAEQVLRELPGDGHIGPYRLERVIGSGGMSVVYLARRSDGAFRQDVAVKVLQNPGRHPDLLRRFEIEREILAQLRHPGIARILDGGVAQGGWPYMVMEFVDGLPLNEYCARNGVPLRQRLELFEKICDAVHHAHRHLIVHRDLKPSNILVSSEGSVKLLDFGIAKLLDSQPTFEKTVPLTETGLRLLTPDYAAPEQIRGEPITTATDVYALGVLLYELLAGERPYRLHGRGPADVERVVCEQDPLPPSATALRTGSALAPDTARVEAGAQHRRAQLKGDLDTICLKALRKEPERRYASAHDLAADLRRHRDGLPVSARPATVRYRLSRFVRRNRLATFSVTAITLLSLAFAVVATIQRAQTERARDVARHQAQRATEVTDFLLGLFAASDPREELGDEPSARDLLERGVARSRALDDQPLLRADMLRVMARAYAGLGQHERAGELLEESLALQQSHPERDVDSWSQTLESRARNHYDLGRYDEARALQAEVLEDRRQRLGEQHRATGLALNALGQTIMELGPPERADSLLTAALAVFDGLREPPERDIMTTRANLAALAASQGNYARAYAMAESLLAQRRRVLGPEHHDVAISLHNLGSYARNLGKVEEAEELYRQSLAIKRQRFPDPHPSIASTLSNLGIALGIQERFEESEEAFLEALRVRGRLLGETHPAVASSWSNLSVLMQRKGDLDQAIEYAGNAVEVYREIFAGPHPSFASALGNLAVALLRADRAEEALAPARESLEQYEALQGNRSPGTAGAWGNLAAVLLEIGRAQEAEALRRRALAVQREVLGETHPDVATSWNGLGAALAAQGQTAKADSAYVRALVLRTERYGPEHRRTVEVAEALARLREP